MAKQSKPTPTADVCDALGDAARVCEPVFGDFGGRDAFEGPIATLSTFEDNTKVWDVLRSGGRGRVLVIDGGGSLRVALIGANVSKLAAEEGWAGMVVNGCLRDVPEVAAVDIGVKALATCPRRPRKEDMGIVDIPVSFAGVTFRPGEYLYADEDGIVVTKEPVGA